MTSFRLLPLGLVSAALLASCAQRLPDVADIDRCYKRAEQLASEETQELERRHAAGQIDDFSYQQQKTAIQNRISQRAVEMAWTSHSLEQSQRAAQGIPTPNSPQEIAVPQAGTLATGGDYRRFNDSDSTVGTTGETYNGMRQMMTSSGFMPGASQHGRSRSSY
jgi:hypothetical protein